MIYLIKAAYLDETDTPRKCLKIGYAKNVEERMVGYGTHNNLNVILLDTREGGIELESLFHQYYKDRIIKIKGNKEWMEYDENIIEEFKAMEIKDLFLNVYLSSDPIQFSFCKVIFNHFYRGEDNLLTMVSLFKKKFRNNKYKILERFLNCIIFRAKDFEELYEELIPLFPGLTIDKDQFIEDLEISLKDYLYVTEDPLINEFATITSTLSYEDTLEKSMKLEEVREICCKRNQFYVKMKAVCDLLLDPKWNGHPHISDFYWLPLTYRNYLNYPGPERIKALGYKEIDVKRNRICFG